MALIKCPQCNNEISDKAEKCPNCGYIVPHILTSAPITSQKRTANISKWLIVASLILVLIGTGFIIKGFHVKNVYKNYASDDYYYDYSDNVNAYVGGDAYNYIINGTYFAGFMALAGTMYLCATGLFCTSLLLSKQENTQTHEHTTVENEEELPSI